jgi:hypothetical protein
MGFRGTANSRKPAVGKNLFQAPFAGLRSKGKANFLAQRCVVGGVPATEEKPSTIGT